MRNIHINQTALWDKETILAINREKDSGFTSVSIVPAGVGQKTQVNAIRLDDYIATFVKCPIGLIKIDVEGAEMNVLQGMSNVLKTRSVPLIIEAQDWTLGKFGYNIGSMISFLKNYDYIPTDLLGRQIGLSDYEADHSLSAFAMTIHERNLVFLPRAVYANITIPGNESL